jgi:DNA-binding NarL/FixJ family response regulator
MGAVGVLVIHRHRLYADAVARRLGREPDVRVAGIASTGAAASTAIEVLGPRIAVLDMGLTDMSSFDLAAKWSSREPPISVVAILGSDDRATLIRALRAGASGVTTMDSSVTELVSAVTALTRDECWVPSRLIGELVQEMQRSLRPPNPYDDLLAGLTAREREILDRMAAGHDRSAIAADLGISINTVRTHAQNLLGKLGVHSSIEAVSVAHRSANGHRPGWRARRPKSPHLNQTSGS